MKIPFPTYPYRPIFPIFVLFLRSNRPLLSPSHEESGDLGTKKVKRKKKKQKRKNISGEARLESKT